MATAGQSLQQQLQSIKARLKGLLNNELKDICRTENLAVSGVKSVLQSRIIERELAAIMSTFRKFQRAFAFPTGLISTVFSSAM